jgi:prevent-host-death family protein
MKAKPLTEVKAKLSEILDSSRREPVLITRNGKPAALLVAVDEDSDLEDIVLANSPAFREIVRESDEEIERGETVSHEELWDEVLPDETIPAEKPKTRRARR